MGVHHITRACNNSAGCQRLWGTLGWLNGDGGDVLEWIAAKSSQGEPASPMKVRRTQKPSPFITIPGPTIAASPANKKDPWCRRAATCTRARSRFVRVGALPKWRIMILPAVATRQPRYASDDKMSLMLRTPPDLQSG